MILYFADRNLNILLTASIDLPYGVVVKDDLKTQETETGVSTFSGIIGYSDDTAVSTEDALTPGNYIFRQNGEEYEVYTIVTSENDNKAQDIEFYAEDGGLELLNDVALKWPDNDEIIVTAKTLTQYFNMFLDRTGFEIGVNESTSEEKLLTFDQEHTVANRLLVIAQDFGCEIDYSFKIEGLKVTKKQVNIYKKKGGDFGVQWRMNKEIDRIVTKATAENLASAFLCYGSIPDGAILPITLADFTPEVPTAGYTIEKLYYADRDDWGYCLCSEKALHVWGTTGEDGELKHVVKVFNYETLSQDVLYEKALEELKRVENVEYNWEVEVADVRDARIGDTVYIVDETGKLYLSARLLKLEESVSNRTKTATLGDYVIQNSGISEKIRELAEQFAGMVVPQITVERNDTTGVTTITATDKNGTTTAEVYDGEPGDPGHDAPTIVSVIPQWCFSSTRASFTKATGYDWQDTMPAYVSGLYYYTRTKTTYSNGNITYSTPILDLSAQVSAESTEAISAAETAVLAAQTAAENAERDAEQAASDAETARTTAVNTANEAKGIAQGTAKHFWYDSSGAHVSDVENSVATGNSVSISSSAIVIMRNGKLVTSWTGSSSSDSALNFYDCSNASARDADLVSSYARSGITYYVNNKRAMSLVSSGLTFWDPTDTTNAGTANQKKQALFAPASVSLYAEGHIAANFAANSLNFYDGSSASASADDLLAAYTRAGITLYTRYSGASANTRAMSLTASGLTFWDPSDTTNSGTSSQRKEAVFGATGVELYANGTKVASFGSTSIIGATTGKHVVVDSNGFTFKSNASTDIGYIKAGTYGTYALSSPAYSYSEGGTTYTISNGLEMASDGMWVRSSGYKRYRSQLLVSPLSQYNGIDQSSGFYVEDPDGNLSGFTLGFGSSSDQTASVNMYGRVAFDKPVNTFVVESHNISLTQTAQKDNCTDTAICTKAGYYPIAIVGYNTGRSQALPSRLYLSAREYNRATVSYSIRAVETGFTAVTMTVNILWVKVVA